MSQYKIVGIDLAKTKFHFAATNDDNKVVLKRSITRKNFFEEMSKLFPGSETFAFEACGGCHHMAQELQALGHTVIVLKPKDVKAYAKTRQKNDINDAIAICKTALDPDVKRVRPKTQKQQEVAYLHKSRQNVIQQRIQRSNSLITSLHEFGYIVQCGKSKFARNSRWYIDEAYAQKSIPAAVKKQMILDSKEIDQLLEREKFLDKAIIEQNKASKAAQLLETVPGIGPINASILSNKAIESYETAKDFAASLGLVPKQNTTGGIIRLSGITKQGDRYARTMLIQAARAVVMRASKPNVPEGKIYQFIERLKKKNKPFNVICVAVANKLARIAYACITKQTAYKTV